MSDFPLSWPQISTLLFFGGFVWWVIRWTMQNLRSQIGASTAERTDLSQDAIDAIVSRNLATPQQLFEMSTEEQRLLAQAALAMVTTATQRTSGLTEGGPPAAHCPACGRLVENFPATVPWKCECVGCGAGLVLRRDGGRLVLVYSPKA